jgi:hypothetical protein
MIAPPSWKWASSASATSGLERDDGVACCLVNAVLVEGSEPHRHGAAVDHRHLVRLAARTSCELMPTTAHRFTSSTRSAESARRCAPPVDRCAMHSEFVGDVADGGPLAEHCDSLRANVARVVIGFNSGCARSVEHVQMRRG